MKKVLNHIKLSGSKEFSLLLVFALLLISELANSQTAASNRFKRIDYDYDLISGKVNTVNYQKDSVDQFIHQYSYDADNRITKVETSSDNVVWDIDAKYYYYAHGPLSRTELGNDKVQGLDYAYTLQGWIKGVNSNSLDKTRDMGQDGLASEIYDTANPQLHSNVATDAFGYTLNYFQNDYKAINVSRWSDVTNRFEADAPLTSTLKTNRFDLFNGNISSMVTTITQLDSTAAGLVKAQIPKPLGNAYKYDQLNRLKKSVSFNNTDLPNNLWLSSGQAVANMYSNTFTYDANGNILSQNRNNELGTEFDAMQYKYKRDANNKFLQNRLYHVNDNTTYTALKTDDIDDEGTFTSDNLLINTNNNYGYDAIGNLTKDKAEQIDTIEWTVYGKIKSITRTGGSTKDNLVFNYDASGNRISKKVLDNGNNIKYTIYYVRDGHGNVMSTYEHKYIAPAGGAGTPVASYVLQEQHLYGSSRLGMNTPNKQLIYPTILSNGTAYTHLQGLKQFELSNHLGNVLAVITDRKLPVDNNGDNIIDYYQADITSTSDYSAFGVKLYNRGFSFDKYRYGFNGQEKDDELKGEGNSINFKYRGYDPRLGTFTSIDPLVKEFPFYSTYQFASNNPILAIDLEGLESSKIKNKTETKTSDKTKPSDKKPDPKALNPATVGGNFDNSIYMGTEHNPKNNDGTDSFEPVAYEPMDQGGKDHDLESGGLGARTPQNLKGDLKLGYTGIKNMVKVIENYVVLPIAGANPNKDKAGKPLTASTTGYRGLAGTIVSMYLLTAKAVIIVVKDAPTSVYDSATDFINEIKYETTKGIESINNWSPH